jgi:hypothetical protein
MALRLFRVYEGEKLKWWKESKKKTRDRIPSKRDLVSLDMCSFIRYLSRLELHLDLGSWDLFDSIAEGNNTLVYSNWRNSFFRMRVLGKRTHTQLSWDVIHRGWFVSDLTFRCEPKVTFPALMTNSVPYLTSDVWSWNSGLTFMTNDNRYTQTLVKISK